MRSALAPKDLRVKELAENIIMGNSPKSVDDTRNKSSYKDNEDQTEKECAGRSNLYISDINR